MRATRGPQRMTVLCRARLRRVRASCPCRAFHDGSSAACVLTVGPGPAFACVALDARNGEVCLVERSKCGTVVWALWGVQARCGTGALFCLLRVSPCRSLHGNFLWTPLGGRC